MPYRRPVSITQSEASSLFQESKNNTQKDLKIKGTLVCYSDKVDKGMVFDQRGRDCQGILKGRESQVKSEKGHSCRCGEQNERHWLT